MKKNSNSIYKDLTGLKPKVDIKILGILFFYFDHPIKKIILIYIGFMEDEVNRTLICSIFLK
jgi:hypothetical protein